MGAWPALARLTPEEISRLDEAIERACRRQRSELEAALRRVLSPPLAALVFARLRGRTP